MCGLPQKHNTYLWLSCILQVKLDLDVFAVSSRNQHNMQYFCIGCLARDGTRCLEGDRSDRLTVTLSSFKYSAYVQVYPELEDFKASLINSSLSISHVDLVVSYLQDPDPFRSTYTSVVPFPCEPLSTAIPVLGCRIFTFNCFNFGVITQACEGKVPAFIYIQIVFHYPVPTSFASQVRNEKDIRPALKTWSEASRICKKYGGHLPIIRSRNELQNIVAMTKFVASMLSVLPIFIGIGKRVRFILFHYSVFLAFCTELSTSFMRLQTRNWPLV